jgi:glycosyltransferase involved in cell wall biosynthesis
VGIALLAEHLPVSPIFCKGAEKDYSIGSVPYFVITGSIEPRKNHLLLLNVWKELVLREASTAPKLIIVGTRRGRCSEVTDTLDRSRLLKRHVIEVAGLSTPSLHRLLGNACALLMPSFAEGFGLPIIEALALGTPVIASDLPAHREAGGDAATYLSPIDGLGWLSEIQAHVSNRAYYQARVARCRIRTWPEYLRKLDAFLEEIHADATTPS